MNEEKKGMTALQVRDYILSKMSAEEALLKLLEAPLIEYQKLRFPAGGEVHPLIIMSIAAIEMGWDMMIEHQDEDSENSEDIKGISFGNDEYFDDLLVSGKHMEEMFNTGKKKGWTDYEFETFQDWVDYKMKKVKEKMKNEGVIWKPEDTGASGEGEGGLG